MIKAIIFMLSLIILIGFMGGLGWAGEKEELQWRGRALIAEYQLQQQRFSEANTALEAFAKELDAKGFMFQGNQVVEKPKPQPPKPEEPKKEKK